MIETVIVTGASRGIGAATARALASPSRHLVLLSRDAAALSERVAEIEALGGHASYMSVDLSEPDDVIEAARALEQAHEHLTGLVSCAGYACTAKFLSSTMDNARYEMRLNYECPLLLVRGLLPKLLQAPRGFVVAVASLTAIVPFPEHATYSASKGALVGLMRSLNAEYQHTNVHFGVVLPGYTKTQMTERFTSMLPSMTPEEVAAAVIENIQAAQVLSIPGRLNKLAAAAFQLSPSLSHLMLRYVGHHLVPTVKP